MMEKDQEQDQKRQVLLDEKLRVCVANFVASGKRDDFYPIDIEGALDTFMREDCEGDIDGFLEILTGAVHGYMLELTKIVMDLFEKREMVVDQESLDKLAQEIPDQYWGSINKVPFSKLLHSVGIFGVVSFFTIFKNTMRAIMNVILAANALLKKSPLNKGQQARVDQLEEAVVFFAHDAISENSLLSLQNKVFFRQDKKTTLPESLAMYKASLRRLLAVCVMFNHRLTGGDDFGSGRFDLLEIINDVFVLMREKIFRLDCRRDKSTFNFNVSTDLDRVMVDGSSEGFFLVIYNITKNIYKLVARRYGVNLRRPPNEVPDHVKLPKLPIQVNWCLRMRGGVIFLEYLDDGLGLAFSEILESLRETAVQSIRGWVESEVVLVKDMAKGSYHSRGIMLGAVSDAIFEKAISSIPICDDYPSSGLGLYEAKYLLALNGAKILSAPRLDTRGIKILIAIPTEDGVDLDGTMSDYMDELDTEEVAKVRDAA